MATSARDDVGSNQRPIDRIAQQSRQVQMRCNKTTHVADTRQRVRVPLPLLAKEPERQHVRRNQTTHVAEFRRHIASLAARLTAGWQNKRRNREDERMVFVSPPYALPLSATTLTLSLTAVTRHALHAHARSYISYPH